MDRDLALNGSNEALVACRIDNGIDGDNKHIGEVERGSDSEDGKG